jgi:hypothetical protein
MVGVVTRVLDVSEEGEVKSSDPAWGVAMEQTYLSTLGGERKSTGRWEVMWHDGAKGIYGREHLVFLGDVQDPDGVVDETTPALARGVVLIARDAGMPDSYWDTDARIFLAKTVLGADEVDRLRKEKQS